MKAPPPSATDARLDIERLGRVPLLQSLSAGELLAMAKAGEHRQLATDAVLFHEGDPGDTVYLLIAGEVRVYQTGAAGSETELTRLGSGSYLGEMAVIDGAPRSASVATISPCEALVFERDEFLTLLTTSVGLLRNFLACFTSKMRASNERTVKLVLARERRRSAGEIRRHRSISAIVAGVSHELNTPLGIINHAASVIEESLTHEGSVRERATDVTSREELDDMLEAAQLILSNSARARTLVTSFKDMSVRQVNDRLERVDLGALVNEIIGLFRLQARKSKIEIQIQERFKDRRLWEGFPGYLSHVLLNLLQNIDRYAYPDGSGGRVVIRLSQHEDGFEVLVADFGRGMPKKVQSEIFTPFFTTGREQGTGLGMAIVYNHVTVALEGSIKVASTPGKGTAITISLPFVVSGDALRASREGEALIPPSFPESL